MDHTVATADASGRLPPSGITETLHQVARRPPPIIPYSGGPSPCLACDALFGSHLHGDFALHAIADGAPWRAVARMDDSSLVFLVCPPLTWPLQPHLAIHGFHLERWVLTDPFNIPNQNDEPLEQKRKAYNRFINLEQVVKIEFFRKFPLVAAQAYAHAQGQNLERPPELEQPWHAIAVEHLRFWLACQSLGGILAGSPIWKNDFFKWKEQGVYFAHWQL